MPKRTDIKTILILGSGPIVIGQGCEFDYSGAQACKALKAEGYRIVLVNSNPATIMTDPAFSDRTYIEPITPEAVRKVIEKENSLGPRIDAILPTLGGQTALNCACKLWDEGTLQEFGIEMIGANRAVIHRAEDRQAFKDICEGIGLKLPKAKTVTTMNDALDFLKEIGLPAIIRPAFTLGGTGGGIAYNLDEFKDIISRGLAASMIGQVQIDQSVIGWKEYELEVVRDKKDNCIIVCGVENIDPMGVHTGDSITVAPILTLTDKEYQAMRDAALAIMRAVGVETGGSNVQFAVNPSPKPDAQGRKPFEMVVVEMNPRVSRSSALASKATGFPIAKIAAKLAVGYTLDELRNDITGTTSACFEPTIDYVVTKMPRWTFEKFPEADETLTTQMKSVGEAMAIGRTFKESLQKVIRSMDVKRFGYGLDRNDKWLAAMRAVERDGISDQPRAADGSPIEWPISQEKLTRKLAVPSQGRFYYIRYAFKMGWTVERINEVTRIDPFFLDQMKQLVEFEDTLCDYRTLEDVPREVLFEAKQLGYSDAQLANLYLNKISPETILKVRARRKSLGVEPVYKLVDTCAAEFEAITPYYYSTYETGLAGAPADDEVRLTDRQKVIILGGGPNRVGQGIEFDYCCCHAAFAARELGFESVMINSNPETVSTDYDTSDLLFFEPLTLEDVMNVVERLNGSPDACHLRVLPEIKAEQPGGGKIARMDLTDLDFTVPHEVLTLIAADLTRRRIPAATIVDVAVSPNSPEEVCRSFTVVTSSGESLSYSTNAYSPFKLLEVSSGPPEAASKFPRDVVTKSDGLVKGLIVQFGGQTPLNLAHGLVTAGAPIIGTSVDSIDLAEDRDRFDALLERLNLARPPSGIARTFDEAIATAGKLGYPVLIRPSYVLGGRGMEICQDEQALRSFITTALKSAGMDDAPVLIDKFLAGAIEVDVDVVADFETGELSGGLKARSPAQPTHQALVAGVLEQIEQAGIHSGDSASVLPPPSLPADIVDRIEDLSRNLAKELKVCGLMNIQLAVKDGHIYIIEVNPRASRTVPFVSKATHVPWPAIAAKCMMGRTLAEQNAREVKLRGVWAVKESVFPFNKFPGVDVVLGPEMRSTGEVMGIDTSFPIAFAKSQMASGTHLPVEPCGVFISVRQQDREAIVEPARLLMAMGYTVFASEGTGAHLIENGVKPQILQKIAAGARPNVIDLMTNGEIGLVINTPTRTGWKTDEGRIRATAVRLNLPMISTTTAAAAAVRAIQALRQHRWDVAALQDYERMLSDDRIVEPVVTRREGVPR